MIHVKIVMQLLKKNNNELISGCVNTFIPNSVISIGPNAFSGSSLTSIDIPYSVLSIGDEAFSGCYRLTSIVIPNSVETIGSNRVFRGCRQLTSIVIPDKVPYIGFWAFEECNNLQSVTIGKNVKTIYQGAFNSCTNLKDLYCKANTIPTSSSSSFEQTNIGNITLHVPESSLDLYRTTEPWSLFGDIVALSEEPTNLGCIGRDGLWYELTVTGDKATAVVYEPMDSKPTGDLVIPSSIVSGGRAFNVVGIRTLRNCDGLTSVTISEGVTKINRAAFDGCTNLKTVNLPESLEEIGDYAFYNLGKLEHVNIPKNVSYIGDEAFRECSNLNIQVEDLEGWLDIILSTTSSEYPFDKNCNLHLFKDGQETVDLVIPNGVESIRDRAFYRFTALSSISIPNSVVTIGTNAFNGCNNVTDVYIDKEEPLTIGSATFSSSYKATLHVPLGCKQAYGAADYWKGFKDVVEVTDRCPTPTISIQNGKLSFSCNLEGVEFHYNVSSQTNGVGNSVNLPVSTTFTISAYASKDGYKDSNTSLKTITIKKGDMNNDGEVTVTDALMIVDMILEEEK